MKKIDKFIVLFAFIATISLAAYCLYLTGRVNKNEIFINQLKFSLNESTDKLAKAFRLMKILGENYQSLNKFNDDPQYLDYKETVYDLLDKNISTIVKQKPLRGEKWFINKVDFISPSFVFVRYEDGHELYVALIQILKTDEGYSFQAFN
ncbi:MAG: hypothetical protein U9R17_17430 [Thermodesulfobacteriota bacterium]|nr:hypothetical protein [Thermodesulfobacteriota bacterium]